MMNGVEARFTVVDNSRGENFSAALAGRQLDFVVSNPPFNAVPKKYAAKLTDFGNGGPHGLDVIEIFLRQALPVMKPNADFLFYSVLARNEGAEFFAVDLLRSLNEGRSLATQFEVQNLPDYDLNRNQYAWALVTHLEQHRYPTLQNHLRLVAEIETGLTRDGVSGVSPVFWTVRQRGDLQPFHVATVDHRPYRPGAGETLQPFRNHLSKPPRFKGTLTKPQNW